MNNCIITKLNANINTNFDLNSYKFFFFTSLTHAYSSKLTTFYSDGSVLFSTTNNINTAVSELTASGQIYIFNTKYPEKAEYNVKDILGNLSSDAYIFFFDFYRILKINNYGIVIYLDNEYLIEKYKNKKASVSFLTISAPNNINIAPFVQSLTGVTKFYLDGNTVFKYDSNNFLILPYLLEIKNLGNNLSITLDMEHLAKYLNLRLIHLTPSSTATPIIYNSSTLRNSNYSIIAMQGNCLFASSTDVDNYLINMSNCVVNSPADIRIRTNRTSASDTAVQTLKEKGYNIYINNIKQ